MPAPLLKPSKLERDVRRYERRQAKAKATRATAGKEARLWQRIRSTVFERDRGRCRVCDVSVRLTGRSPFDAAHVHHIKYRSAGGTDNLENLVLLCGVCHDDEHQHRIDITGNGDGQLVVTRRSA